MNAAELDAVLQRQKAEKEGRDIEWCSEQDPQKRLPCTKIKGHDGPHYNAW